MADAIITASLVPKNRSRDLGDVGGTATPGADADIAAVVDAVSGVDATVVDPGNDLVTSLDISVTDGSVTTAQNVVTAVLALDTDDVFDDGGSELVLELAPGSEVKVEADPTLAATALGSPINVAAIVEDDEAGRAVLYVDPTLFGATHVASTTVTTSELASASIPVAIRGIPTGHPSQRVPDGRVIVKFGPAPAATAGEYDVVVNITDSNGRTPSSALTTQVYVVNDNYTGPSLDSDDGDDALSLADDAAADTTVLTATADTPCTFELVSALTQSTGADDISEIITVATPDPWGSGSQDCDVVIDPDGIATNPEGVYDVIFRATDALGNTDDYTLALTIT